MILAIAITFAYQLTFLLAIVTFALRFEHSNRHCVLPCLPVVEHSSIHESVSYQVSLLGLLYIKPEDSSWFQRYFLSGTINRPSKVMKLNEKGHSERDATIESLDAGSTVIRRLIKTHYAPFLMKPSSKILIGFIYAGYLGASIYGCTILKNGLQPTKLVLDDSPVVTFYKLQEAYFWETGYQVQIAFSQAPDLALRENRLLVQDVLLKFATSRHGLGLESMEYFIGTFAEYMLDNGVFLDSMVRSEFYDNLRFFLSFDENARFRNDIRWANETSRDNITAFRALVGLRNFGTAQYQIEAVDDFRAMAAQYPNYGYV